MTADEAYQLLLKRYDRPCLPLDEVRAEYLSSLGSTEDVLEKIHKGEIRLRYTRLYDSRKARPVVYLRDLANWLVVRDPSNTQPAAHQVA